MAVTDAYATAVAYRARTDKTDTADDATIDALLSAVSRLFDRECERFFTKDAAVVARIYDGSKAAPRTANAEELGLFTRGVPLVGEGTRLYIDDVASVTGLVVKVDLNADYDYADAEETLTKDTHYWIGPPNADKGSEPRPFRFLDVLPGNGRLARWPDQMRSVEVTAVFGWPAVPGAIKEATVMVTRELRDLEESGMTLSLQNIDQAVNLSPAAFSLVQRIKREYGRQAPSFV